MMSEAYDLTEVMTISDMAYTILKQNQNPLHYKEIFDEISKVKQVKNSGSVQSCIYAQEPFIRMGDGYWGLTEWLLNGLSFIYVLSPLEYERGVLRVDYDHEIYFPGYIKKSEAKFKIQNREHKIIRKNTQTFMVEDLYEIEEIEPNDKLIIEILDIDNLEYKIYKWDEVVSELKDRRDNFDKKVRELAFQVLKEQRGIMSSARILEQILIKTLDNEDNNDFRILPLPPISEIISDDRRFKERLPGMFTLNL